MTWNEFINTPLITRLRSYAYMKDILIAIVIFIIVVIVVSIFAYILYDVLIDQYVLDDSFFLTGFKRKMTQYGFLGYAVACICFTSYLLLAQKVNQLNELTRGSLSVPGDINKFKLLQTAFRNAFALSALILSLFIIWMGVMFHAVNSLELMVYFRRISGKDFFNNDFIYLVGLMHSLLLLIFYIPVQIAFNSISIVEEQKAASTQGLTPFKKGFIGFFESFSSVLITASPLVTSLIQGLIDNFLKE